MEALAPHHCLCCWDAVSFGCGVGGGGRGRAGGVCFASLWP